MGRSPCLSLAFLLPSILTRSLNRRCAFDLWISTDGAATWTNLTAYWENVYSFWDYDWAVMGTVDRSDAPPAGVRGGPRAQYLHT